MSKFMECVRLLVTTKTAAKAVWAGQYLFVCVLEGDLADCDKNAHEGNGQQNLKRGCELQGRLQHTRRRLKKQPLSGR